MRRRAGARPPRLRAGPRCGELVHEPMKTLSIRMSAIRLVRLERHVAAARAPIASRLPGVLSRARDRARGRRSTTTISGDVPQVTCGRTSRGVELDDRVPVRVGVGVQRAPVALRACSHSRPVGRERAALARRRSSSRRLPISPARAPASIAMLQTVMRPSMLSARIARAGELDRVAGAAGGADLADDRQHDVLRRCSRGGKRAVDAHAACSSPCARAASASPARARPRWCRCRARARRTRRGSRCASRRRRPSCPAASRPAPGRSRGRCPGAGRSS